MQTPVVDAVVPWLARVRPRDFGFLASDLGGRAHQIDHSSAGAKFFSFGGAGLSKVLRLPNIGLKMLDFWVAQS